MTAEPLQKEAYRVPDAAKDKTESWLFDVTIREAQGRDVEPVGARIELLAAGKILKTVELGPLSLKAITRSAPRPLPAKANPALHRIRFKFTEPAGFPVDKVRCRIDLAFWGSRTITRRRSPARTATSPTPAGAGRSWRRAAEWWSSPATTFPRTQS